MSIFHHSSAFIAKHKRHHHLMLATLALIIASAGVYTFRHEFAQAATYTFTQNLANGGWVSASTTATASHSVNGDSVTPPGPWTKYSATSSTSVLASGSGVSLASSSRSIVSDGFLSDPIFEGSSMNVWGFAFDTANNLYVADNVNPGKIYKINATSSAVTTFATVGSSPTSLVFDGAGNLYTANSGSPYSISKVTPSGTVTTFANLGANNNPYKLAFDSENNLYTANYTSGTVSKITPQGATSTLATVGSNPIDLTFDSTGNLYVLNNGSNSISKITFSTPGILSTSSTTWATVGNSPNSFAFDAANNLYVVSSFSTTIYKVSPSGAVTPFATLEGNPVGIVIDKTGNLYVHGGTSKIYKITQSAVVTILTTFSYSNGRALALDLTGNILYGNHGRSPSGNGIAKLLIGGSFESGTNSSTVQTGVGSAASVGLGSNLGLTTTGSPVHTTVGGYEIYKYTSSGTFQITSGTADVEYLVVGGGGGGGGGGAGMGGGGAGGFRTGTLSSMATMTYTVTVGAGGATSGVSGATSTFSTIDASGGGGGGTFSSPAGKSGGSGGGCGGLSCVGALGNVPPTTPSQGNDGGTSSADATGGSGGGGAGGGGAGGYNGGGGNGGVGAVSSIALLTTCPAGGTAPNCYYGGGGGGGNSNVVYGVGGLGGGGSSGVSATGGTANTGGGGGGRGPSGSGSGLPGAGGSGVVIVRYPQRYVSPGTFTSAVINLGAKVNPSVSPTLSWTTGGTGTITMEYATSTDNSTWSAYSAITNGGNINGASAGIQYIKYKATFTGDGTTTPTLNDVTVGYSQYAGSGDLTSSKYDTGVLGNTFSKVLWSASDTNASSTVTFQVRTSADGSTWTAWCGPVDCSGVGTNGFFTRGDGLGVDVITNGVLTDSVNDQWIQYKAFLTSGGDITPTLTSATLQYVQNGAPSVTNLSAVSQASNGTITATYDVSDDTNTSVTVSLQYCTTSCTPGSEFWVTANTVTGDIGTVAVGTGKSITWTPATDYAPQYKGAQEIRIKANDSEGANNLGYGTSNTFILDTTVPSVTNGTFDSTQDIFNLTTTDNSAISYRLCNATCSSEAWNVISTQGAQAPISWTPVGFGSGTETVYLEVKDIYNNITQSTIIAPATPGSFLVADVSNPGAGTYGESLSWIAPSGATSYNIYYATTSASTVAPTSYAPLAMGATSNVYNHTITTATSSAYWYKVSAIGSGNTSNFVTENTGDVPDSFGTALSDTTAPVVQSVATSSVLSTSAVVTVVTDELASIQIFYSPSGYVSGCLYTAHTQPSAVYSTSTVVALTGLSPSTTYDFCVKATDIAGNPSLGTSSIENSSFITVSGPTISNVTLQNLAGNSVTIMWNTATSSDSYVHYSTSPSLANPVAVGSTTMVPESVTPGMFQHQVGLSGLTAGTTYYYKIKSTDGDGNSVTDPSDGTYRNLITLSDTTAPSLVGEITTPVKSSTAIVIVWQTDEPATSQVRWGLASTTLDRITELDSTKSIYHVVTLSSATNNIGAANNVGVGSKNELSAATPYFYTVESSDLAAPPENMMTSPVQTVTTAVDGAATISYVYVRSSSGDATLDILPPAISNVVVSDITPFGATVKFGTSEDSATFVDYGKDTSYGQSEGDKIFSTTHTIKLHGLTLGTDYHIKVSAIDKAGNTGTSADQTFKTTFLSENLKDMANVENIEQFQKEIESAIESILPSLVPPFVTKPIISDITESGATISFKTNIKAFPVVVYAEDGAYDETKENPYTGEVSDTVTKDTTHSLTLTGLKGNTKYHVQARAFSLPKVIGKSADVTFITKASKIAGSIVERKKDSFTVVWTTEEPTTSIVEFKDLKRGITERKVDEAKKTSHSMKIENLPSGTAYEVNLSGLTEQGNIAEAGSPLSVTTSTDTTPPTISGFKVDNALVPGRTDRIQTIVSWVTDEPSNSTVYYEEGAGTAGDTAELANKNEVLDSFVTGHSVILPSLKPGTIYRLKVTSADDSGNLGSFGPRTVITPQQTASITDIIFKNFEDSFKFLRKI